MKNKYLKYFPQHTWAIILHNKCLLCACASVYVCKNWLPIKPIGNQGALKPKSPCKFTFITFPQSVIDFLYRFSIAVPAEFGCKAGYIVDKAPVHCTFKQLRVDTRTHLHVFEFVGEKHGKNMPTPHKKAHLTDPGIKPRTFFQSDSLHHCASHDQNSSW